MIAGWALGFWATLGILALADSSPRLYRILITPIAVFGVGAHDGGMILVLLFSPAFYGSIILGSGYLILRIIRKIAGALR